MKVSVITRHAVSNYGSLLQALATQKLIEQLGHQSEIIDYVREDELPKHIEQTMLRLKPRWNRNLATKVLYLSLRQPASLLAGWRFAEERKKYLRLSNRYTSVNELRRDKPKADIYMTGSDQVWGPIGADSFDDAYLLSFCADDDKKVSLAASFGRVHLGQDEASLRSLLSRYDLLTVREDSAVEKLTSWGMHSQQVLDPTLLLAPKTWETLASPPQSKDDYVLVYEVHNNPRIGSYAAMLAEAEGVSLFRVSPALHQVTRPGRLMLLPTAAEFLSYIKHARYMVTDSFHGTVFALVFKTPFIEVLPNETATRNSSILSLTGLSERILTRDDDLELAGKPIDFEAVHEKLALERAASLRAIEKMIR